MAFVNVTTKNVDTPVNHISKGFVVIASYLFKYSFMDLVSFYL